MQKLSNWLKKRLSQFEGQVLSKLRPGAETRTYIVPTRFGVFYGLTCFLLFLIAIIYQNNLVFLSLFSLVSFALWSLHQTNKAVKSCMISVLRTGDFYAGSDSDVYLKLQTKFSDIKYQVYFQGFKKHTEDISVGEDSHRPIICQIAKRGVHALPALQVSTDWPFGLARSWKWIRFPQKQITFPNPQNIFNLQEKQHAAPDGAKGQQRSQDQFMYQGHKAWHSGIAFQKIDWLVYSRLQQFTYADFTDPASADRYVLSYKDLSGKLKHEEALSQLCAWVLFCETHHKQYCLEIEGNYTDFAFGPRHKQECLNLLAVTNEL